MKKYYFLDDGSISRAGITMDIETCEINADEIKKIAANPEVKKAFIGEVFRNKKPKSEWDEKHLKSVSYYCMAESFNLDYMLYLNEVAEYVAQMKLNKKSRKLFKYIIIAAVAVIIIIAAVIIFKNAAVN